MSKGLYHCSKCKKHFYDAEATAMHITDAHGGDGHVLRHPTKRELLLQAEIKDRRIAELEAMLNAAHEAIEKYQDRLNESLDRRDAMSNQISKALEALRSGAGQ